MKSLIRTISFFALVLIASFSLWSCGYTTNTSGSKQFAKKHYNRGIVKTKSSKKSNSTIAKLDLKETKILVEQAAKQEAAASTYTAATTEVKTEDLKTSNVMETVYAQTESFKSDFTEMKENASTEKEIKKANRGLKQVDRMERLMQRVAPKIAAKANAAAPNAIAPPASDGMGIASLVLGILSITIFGILTGIAAIILGNRSGSNLGTIGMILGWISVALTILAILLIILVL